MAVGVLRRERRFEDPADLLGDRLTGLYGFLAEHGAVLYPDDYFADLYAASRRGRPTVPARVVATVMILQSFEGLSDQEAVDRLGRDLAWQAAAGVHLGYTPFHPTVLVGMRNRLRASMRPRRLFEDSRAVAVQTGALGRRARALDSTPLYDAVATQDTVTQLRAAIRKLLAVLDRLDPDQAGRVRTVLGRDDDYATSGKPPCDYDDVAAKDQLVDALVKDARAALAAVDGHEICEGATAAVELLAVVAGQDVECADDGSFRIARNVATDRVISTVDPQARHGHKSRNRRFDGYKAHVAIDPDSELIDEVVVTPANTPDSRPVTDLLAPVADADVKPEVLGDCAYATADTLADLTGAGYVVRAKVPSAANRNGLFSKDDFTIDMTDGPHGTVTCPAGVTADIRPAPDGGGRAAFGVDCNDCALQTSCTTAAAGRQVTIHPHEGLLQQAKAAQATKEWQQAYNADRPKVERKIAHLMRRMWGARKARTRGLERIATDLDSRAAAVNLARLNVLGARAGPDGWALNPT
ncbi:hypothetical protein BH24ACT15_BH24ACT15_32850 [soil metagenome]